LPGCDTQASETDSRESKGTVMYQCDDCAEKAVKMPHY
jgi:hypothetical protein